MDLGLSLAINRLGTAKAYLKAYLPGVTLTGETFTRAGPATYYDSNGVVQTALSGVKRDNHYVSGIRTLLLESSKTNLALQSQDLTTTWTTNLATVAGNSTTAPDGTLTASKVQETNVSGQHFAVQSFTKAASALPYSLSFFLEQAERTWAFISLDDGTGTNGESYWVNLGTGVMGTLSKGGYTNPLPSSTASISGITANGFYIVTLMSTSTAGTTLRAIVSTSTADTTTSYLGVTGSGIYGWGAQLEQAAFPSSYIATTTVAVTRAVDAYSIPGVTAAGSPRLYQRYWNLATRAWVDSDTAYTSGTAIVPAVDRAYAGLAVFPAVLTTAQYRSALGI